MIPFRIQLRPGVSISEQIIYAAKRAIVSGELCPGDPFPSVRVLSREAHINPNTAHKIIAVLLAEELLESRPGVGTVVSNLRNSTLRARKDLLGHQVETLVVEAKRFAIPQEDVLESVIDHWRRLTTDSTESGTTSKNPGDNRK